MNNYFECKIRYEKTMENGSMKKVTETFLVDALSFTEAEARIIQEVTPFITGEFTVSEIKRAKLSEIFEDETGDRFYLAVVAFVSISERTGGEKESKVNMLVQSVGIDEAKDSLRKGMQGTMADYVIKSIKETDIVDVYKFERE